MQNIFEITNDAVNYVIIKIVILRILQYFGLKMKIKLPTTTNYFDSRGL